MSYYNTTNLTGEALKKRQHSARSQEERLLILFNDFKMLSPSQAHKIYNRTFKPVPITSIRRAITELTQEGKLIKTDQRSLGDYGHPESCWKIK